MPMNQITPLLKRSGTLTFSSVAHGERRIAPQLSHQMWSSPK